MKQLAVRQKGDVLFEIMNLFLILFFAAYYILSSFTSLVPYTYVFLFECFCCALFFVIGDEECKIRILKYVLLILLLSFLFYFFTVTSAVSVKVENYDLKRFFSKLNQLVNFFFPILLLSRFVKIKSRVCKVYIILIVVVLFLYVVINSYITYQQDNTLSRNWETFSELEQENVATYYFVYAVSVLIPILFTLQRNNKNIFVRVVAIIGIVILYLFLFSAQYMLAILIPTICIVYSLINSNKGSVKVLIITLLALFVLFLPALLLRIADYVSSDIIKTRLQAVAHLINLGPNTINEDTNRLELYKKCFEYFLYSPIIGNISVPFDGHATFLTILCDLGIMGTTVTYALYFGSRREIRYLLNDNPKYDAWFAGFLCMVFIGFTNPIQSANTLGYVLYFVGPAMLILKKEKNNEQI